MFDILDGTLRQWHQLQTSTKTILVLCLGYLLSAVYLKIMLSLDHTFQNFGLIMGSTVLVWGTACFCFSYACELLKPEPLKYPAFWFLGIALLFIGLIAPIFLFFPEF